MERFQGSRSSTRRQSTRNRTSALAATLAAVLFTLISTSSSAKAIPAEYAVGPDNNLELLLKTIDSAKKRIIVNIYEFNHLDITEHLIRKIKNGVEVQILFETQPCCSRKMDELGKKVVRDLYEAMRNSGRARHRIYLMGSNPSQQNSPTPPETPPTASARRFIYNHAKYLIIDGKRVHMSSENFTPTGHPESGTVGNRGWDIALEDSTLASQMLALFREDANTTEKDILEIQPTRNELPGWLSADGSTPEAEMNPTRSQPRMRLGNGHVSHVEVVTSPMALPGIEKFMDYAHQSLDLQFMSLPANWGRGQNTLLNPIVEKLVSLAQSGVSVRVLLNDPRTFESESDVAIGNEITVALLEKIGKCRGYNLSAKIIDVENTGISYIHNKGMIVDHDRVFISSINGTQNSVEKNRETAFSIQSKDANGYFKRVFNSDWNQTSWNYSNQRTAVARQDFLGCPQFSGGLIFQPGRTPGTDSFAFF